MLPYKSDSFGLRYGYNTLVSAFTLIICLFGSKSFGRTSVFILVLVLVSALMLFTSFVPDKSLFVSFTYTTNEIEYCVPPSDESKAR